MSKHHRAVKIAYAYNKCLLVIESCKTLEQLDVAHTMVDNFYILYGPAVVRLRIELDMVMIEKAMSFIQKM